MERFLGQHNEEPVGRKKAAIIDACSAANRNVLRFALEEAHAKLSTSFGKASADMYVIAVVLDPRLRTLYFETSGWEPGKAMKSKEVVLNTMQKYRKEAPPPPPDVDYEACLGPIHGEVFGGIEKYRVEERDELERYLSEQPSSEDTDILEWWRQHAGTYPCLARIARDYLAIPATSAPAERVFSGGADVVSKKRASLNENTIEASICLGSWL
jgi:hypothetical protein